MGTHNTRHNNARVASRAFIESVFSEVGTELSFSEITIRAIKAGVASSTSVINNVCMLMMEEGFLVRVKKGVYARTDPRGPALPLPEPPAPSAPPSPDTLEVLRLAGLESRLIGLDKRVSSLQATLDQILDLLTAPK